MRVLLITGTGTGVGKTIATAAITACALRAGQTVAVVKPAQTGALAGEAGDLAEVRRLTGQRDLHELERYDEPLAPATAARRVGASGLPARAIADHIRALAGRDLVIVEGAGGALVRFNEAGETLLDVGRALILGGSAVPDTGVLVVASAGLGVLNVAALTADAISRAGLSLHGVLVGSFPAQPDLAERCNLIDLAEYSGAPLLGVLPAGAGRAGKAEFADVATRSLSPTLGGSFDSTAFIEAHNPSPVTRGAAS